VNAAKLPNSSITPVASHRTPFDWVTIAFHWATVFAVFAMFATAWWHSYADAGVLRSSLLQIHRSLGVTIWWATVLRLTWRMTKAKLPPFPSKMTIVHRNLVKASEYALYGLLLIQPATGLATTLLRGRQFPIFLWRIPSVMPEHTALEATFYWAHQLGACTLGILVAGHAAAALIHHFVLRDDVLECMAPVLKPERRKRTLLPPRIIRRPSFASER
jgi:superoxide oxidase